MSYQAPKHIGYPFSRGGNMYFLAGHDGENYRSKRHKISDPMHKLAKKEPKQNHIDEEEEKVQSESGGTQQGVVMNEITLDRQKQPGAQTLDRNGPLTDAVAIGKRQLDTAGETQTQLQYMRYGQKL